MKSLSFLLLGATIVLAPLRLNAMNSECKEEEREETSKDKKEKTKENSTRNQVTALKKAAERQPSFASTTEVIEENEMMQSNDQREEPQELHNFEATPPTEKENFFDVTTLESRLKEAQEVIGCLQGKGEPLKKKELEELGARWSSRYERYRQKLDTLLQQSLFARTTKPPIEEKLVELVKASLEVVKELTKALENFSQEETERIDFAEDFSQAKAIPPFAEQAQEFKIEDKEKTYQQMAALHSTLSSLYLKVAGISKKNLEETSEQLALNHKAIGWIEKTLEGIRNGLAEEKFAAFYNRLSAYQHTASSYYLKAAAAEEANRPEIVKWYRLAAQWVEVATKQLHEAKYSYQDKKPELSDDLFSLAHHQIMLGVRYDKIAIAEAAKLANTVIVEQRKFAAYSDIVQQQQHIWAAYWLRKGVNSHAKAISLLNSDSLLENEKKELAGYYQTLARYQRNIAAYRDKAAEATKDYLTLAEWRQAALSWGQDAAESQKKAIDFLEGKKKALATHLKQLAWNQNQVGFLSSQVIAVQEEHSLAETHRLAIAKWARLAAGAYAKSSQHYLQAISLLESEQKNLAERNLKIAYNQTWAGDTYYQAAKKEVAQKPALAKKHQWIASWFETAAKSHQEVIDLLQRQEQPASNDLALKNDLAKFQERVGVDYHKKANENESIARENVIKYSPRKINIKDLRERTKSVDIPRVGAFYAGEVLLNELNEELLDLMITNVTKKDDSIEVQNKKDIARIEKLLLKENGMSYNLSLKRDPTDRYSPEFENLFRERMLILSDVLENPYLTAVVRGIMNQSLMSLPAIVFFGTSRASQASSFGSQAGSSHHGVSHTTSGAIGFPFNKEPYDVALQKVDDSFFPHLSLSLYQRIEPACFFLEQKEKADNENGPFSCFYFEPTIKRMSTTQIDFRIIPTLDSFNPHEPYSRENFPCTTECSWFSNVYTLDK